MKTYPYQTPEGIIELVEQREYDEAIELLREIRDNEVNPQDEADRFLRDHQPSELLKARQELDEMKRLLESEKSTRNAIIAKGVKIEQANAELIERLAEARESHLHASARDVQTIQRQNVLLERLANELHGLANMPEHDQDDAHRLRHIAGKALSAYESSNLEPVANPIDEAIKRMEAVPVEELDWIWDNTGETAFDGFEAVRARLIQAAKGEQL
jgi:hypothetical protein